MPGVISGVMSARSWDFRHVPEPLPNMQNRNVTTGRTMDIPFRVLLYRYVFFAWLFKDMSRQCTLFERAAAWRHNREQSRWLPLYMLRYVVAGLILGALGFVAESLSPVLSAIFFVPGSMTVPMFAVAGVAWTGLRVLD